MLGLKLNHVSKRGHRCKKNVFLGYGTGISRWSRNRMSRGALLARIKLIGCWQALGPEMMCLLFLVCHEAKRRQCCGKSRSPELMKLQLEINCSPLENPIKFTNDLKTHHPFSLYTLHYTTIEILGNDAFTLVYNGIHGQFMCMTRAGHFTITTIANPRAIISQDCLQLALSCQ